MIISFNTIFTIGDLVRLRAVPEITYTVVGYRILKPSEMLDNDDVIYEITRNGDMFFVNYRELELVEKYIEKL